jgi:hypothetical protein
VWLEGTNLAISHSEKKFKPRRYGPFTITKVISNIVYELALPSHWKIHNVFHASLLTPYHETPIHGPNHHEPPPDVINGEPEWEVDEVIGLRTFGRRKEKQYRIRWKGYSPAHDTWEPAANVHAPELIQDFLKKKQGRHKSPTMSDENLPVQLSLIAMNPDATSHPSTPPSPSPLYTLLRMTGQAGLSITDAQAATMEAVHDQPEPADHPDMTSELLEPQDASPTPPSPWPITRLLHLATQGGIKITEQEAAAIEAIRVQEEEPQNAPIPDSPAYSPTSPTLEASRPTTPDLTYPGPDLVHHSQINISPDMPAWPWMERCRYPSTASVPYQLADHEECHGLPSSTMQGTHRGGKGEPRSWMRGMP